MRKVQFHLKSLLRGVALCMFLCSFGALAEPVLDSVAEIRDLTSEQAGKSVPVIVLGQVLWKNPYTGSFFLHSDGVGIYVEKSVPNSVSVGEVVRIKGVSKDGNFTPALVAQSIDRLGMQPLPEARPFHTHEIYSTKNDCDWVHLACRIESMQVFRKAPGAGRIVLETMFNDVVLNVQLPLTDEAEKRVRELMFCRVKFNAVVGTQFNTNRQIVGRIMYVASSDDLEVIDDWEPSAGLEIKPIHELVRNKDVLRHAVGTRGLVTYVEGQHIYLRGETACIKVAVREGLEVKVGDYVELIGFARHGEISPSFLAREVRVVDHQLTPEPLDMQLNEELRIRWDEKPDAYLNYELVQIKAQLVEVTESFGMTGRKKEHTLLCRQGKYVFTVKLPFDLAENKALVPGATIQVSGICNLMRNEEWSWRLYVDWFWMQPRDAADIKILTPAPWWTTGRLLGLLGLVIGGFVLSLLWIIALKKTVEKQTEVIQDKVKSETVHDERQRIARELHDNLAQGLAGIALQLKGCRKLFEYGADKNKIDGSLSLMQQTLEHCSTEARNSIFDLRGGLLEQMDLPAALQEILKPLLDEHGAVFNMQVNGEVRRLPFQVERNLMLVAREAGINATRHASPSMVQLELTYGPDSLSLSIMDDGCGFDTWQSPPVGHFGLNGMRERIYKIRGQFAVESELGKGTVITVELSGIEGLEKA